MFEFQRLTDYWQLEDRVRQRYRELLLDAYVQYGFAGYFLTRAAKRDIRVRCWAQAWVDVYAMDRSFIRPSELEGPRQ
jgi:hypothetical protein